MINFYKYQGLGNDFIIINNMENKTSLHEDLIRKLCDRRFGVGADGIVFVEKSSKADARMVFYNSDGTCVSMCGNASRCFSKYLYDKNIIKKENITIETDAGILEIALKVEAGVVKSAKVNMGKPDFSSKHVLCKIDGNSTVNYPIKVEGEHFYITSMFLGVPHTVIFEDHLKNDITDDYIIEKGRLIENLPIFPQKTNVDFVKIVNRREINVRTWERAAGYTLACGTGASASVAAGIINGFLDEQVTVHLRGGDLLISWDGKNDVFMEGPAEEVFSGLI